jgi:Sec-independent protein translocase protein TatA
MGFAEIAVVAIVFYLIFGRRRSWPGEANLGRSVRELQDEVTALRSQLEQQRVQLEELAERLDFSERVVAQLREAKALPPPAPPN